MNKLSVIVPVYNGEKYLKKCIESIINQTYKNLEIIIIDDGSSDNSIEIINKYAYKDKRIKLFKQKNLGVSAARNLGIKNSTGELLTFIDCDDWIELNTYQLLINELEFNNSELAMYSFVREYKRKQVFEKLPFEEVTLIKNKDITYNLIANLIAGESENECPIMGSVWRCIFKKSLIEKYNIFFDVSISFGEDLIFLIEYLLKCKRVSILNKHLYHYRFQEMSAISRYNDDLWDKSLKLNNKLNEIFNSNELIRKRIDKALAVALVRNMFNVFHKDNKSNFYRKYRQVKFILNNKQVIRLRKNHNFNGYKYKIFKYNLPILVCFMVGGKSFINSVIS